MCLRPRQRLRKPRVTSAARVKDFTKINFAIFFDICEPMLRLIIFSTHRLLNYEETGLCVVHYKVCKVISLKGKRKISLSSAERGSLVTIVTCMNATFTYVSPLLVFPRSNMNAELQDSPPPWFNSNLSQAGWIQKHSLTQRFKHFVRVVKPLEKIALF